MCFVFRVKEVCIEREYSFIIKLMMSFTRARYFFFKVVSVVFVKHSFHTMQEKKNLSNHPREEKREERPWLLRTIHHAHE